MIDEDTILSCGHTPTPSDPVAGFRAAGYGEDPEGNTFCYPCAALRDREQLRSAKAWTGYVTMPPKGASGDGMPIISNWPGSLALLATGVRVSKRGGGFGSGRMDVWFTFEGRKWHGVNRGDNMVLRCRALKAA